MVYGRRYGARSFLPEDHTIAIAYKTSDWVLIDMQHVDFMEVNQWLPDNLKHYKSKQAMLCLMQNQKTKTSVIFGNAHFEHNPRYDYVKYAQAIYYL